MRNRMPQTLAGAAGALLLAGPPRIGADTLEVSIYPTTNTDDQQETTPILGFDDLSNQVAELRFFGGLSLEETGKLLGISLATVERDWQAARAWLFKTLSESPPRPDA
jgi:DNA-directed RNA polymerase specialized sigma subunit